MTIADSKAAWYAANGYYGSLSDMEFAYFSNPPTQIALGFVRTVAPAASTFVLPVTNYTHYVRVIEGGTITAIRMSINVVSGNICLAVYRNTGSGLSAKPGTRVATTGIIACPAITPPNYADVPLGQSVAVQAGDWLAFGADNNVISIAGQAGTGLYGNSYGLFAGESIFPAPVTPNPLPNNVRMLYFVGVP